MKNLAFFFLLFVAVSVSAQKHILPDKQQIIQVLRMQQSAWNRGDLEEFMQGYWKSDSLSFVGKKGITRGWQATLDNYKKSYPDKATMGELVFDILSVDLLSKEAAFVVGKWELKRGSDKGNLGGHFTLLLKKIKNKWVIVNDHTS
jgi:ketosteroid isomerase-like protein